MVRMLQIAFLIVIMPLFSYSQNKLSKIKTESTFANQGNYNRSNHHILFVGINVDTITKSFDEVSIRVKDMISGKETIVVPNIYLSSPVFGWIDSSHVFYDTSVPIGESKVFGPWKGYLVKYNIYTQQKDTLPSSWYSSDNYVSNFYASDGKLFYTISYKGEEKAYWMEYFFNTGKELVINKQNESTDFNILTYQYLPKKDEVIYIKADRNKHEFIRFSLSTGKEKNIRVIKSNNSIESSALDEDNFYYLERITPDNSEGMPDLKNSNYVINSININTGVIREVYSFDKGVEVSKIDLYGKGRLLLSVQGRLKENTVEKNFDLPKGGDITIGLNPTSNLYILSI